MKAVNIAIASETPSDIIIYQILCNKILLKLKVKTRVPKNLRISLKTKITTDNLDAIKDSIKRGVLNPELILICTDTDGVKNTKEKLNKKASGIGFMSSFIIVTPHTKIEDWLIKDLSALNKALKSKLSAEERDKAKDSKIWLNEQIKIHRSHLKAPYETIAHYIDIKELLKKEDFEHFQRSLIEFFENREKIRINSSARIKKPKINRKERNLLHRVRQWRHILLPKQRRQSE